MLNRKGQNIAEYSILIALVIAAAVAMQTYVKRGIQGRIADVVDHAPAIDTAGAGNTTVTLNFNTKQYEPYYLDSEADVSADRTYDEAWAVRGGVDRTNINETTTRATGSYEEMEWVNETAR